MSRYLGDKRKRFWNLAREVSVLKAKALTSIIEACVIQNKLVKTIESNYGSGEQIMIRQIMSIVSCRCILSDLEST